MMQNQTSSIETRERPRCEPCGIEMWLVSSVSADEGVAFELLTFECPVCQVRAKASVDRWSGEPARAAVSRQADSHI